MKVIRATRKAVIYACLKFHYAKAVPVYQYAYNIYNDNNEWCGCIVFGLGAARNMAHYLNCISGTCLELQRVALNGKQGHNKTSQCVSMAMRELNKDAVLLKCIFSYADTGQGHTGILYQATNFIYIGLSKSPTQYIKDGVICHSRTLSDRVKRSGKSRKELGFELIKGTRKHLYLYTYDKRLRKEFMKRKQEYPKNESKTM